MSELRVRPMTAAEFDTYRARAVKGYAEAHVLAGDWSPEQAPALAAEQTNALLPDGIDTAGMVLLMAEADGAGVVGTAWIALEEPNRRGAWIYDIEVAPEQRGKGYGRALLEAIERIVDEHGVESMGLNVFVENAVARGLYDACGYEPTSIHMRKTLGG